MRRHHIAAALLVAATLTAPGRAQVPPAELGQRYIPAPWWMREPVIASIGAVRTEMTANRASFSASFSAVAKTAAEATTAAAAQVRAIDTALRGLGAERARLQTSFSTRPLYEQYREKDGTRVDNERADKIERYEVVANLQIEVRDMAVLERAYSAVVNAQPTSVGAVNFTLEPDNAAKTALYGEAVRDAARRARLSAEAAGARLGPAKIVDPSGRVCQTDVLAGWRSYVGGVSPTDVAPPPPEYEMAAPAMDVVVTGARKSAAPIEVTLQPPRLPLVAEACVIYALQ